MCGRQKEFGCILRMDAQSPTYFSPQHTTEDVSQNIFSTWWRSWTWRVAKCCHFESQTQ
jgi:hypothetical protein